MALMSLGIAAAIVSPTARARDRVSVTKTQPDAIVIHALNRLGYGPRPGDLERVQAMGLSKYVDRQLHPERIDDTALDARLRAFTTLGMSTDELAQKYFLPALQVRRDALIKQQRANAKAERSAGETPDAGTPGMAAAPEAPPAALPAEARMALVAQQQVLTELMQARMLRAVFSERQLQEVLTDFWFNHFNVFVGKGQVRQYLTSYERDVIRPNVLGNFRTLLGAVAHSPAMLFYLDNFQSAAADTTLLARPGAAGVNRRPAITPRPRVMAGAPQRTAPARPTRGLNENYAREIMELHTLGVDAGYTQDDVIALARILTGWTIDRPQQGGAFVFRPRMHDNGAKKFLGVTFAPDGAREGERALDLLARHPATAHHIAYQLTQRFVADDPPSGLVDRAAAVFLKTRGDLREVVRTIITSPEFLAAGNIRGKVKTPFEFVVSAVRATGAEVASSQPLVTALRNLGMPLYGCQPPTGYSMTADAWVNTGSLLNRMNFAVQLVSGGRVAPTEQAGRGGRAITDQQAARRATALQRHLDIARGPITVDAVALAGDAGDTGREALIDALLNGDASPATRQTLARAETPQTLVALALGSPEFQRR